MFKQYRFKYEFRDYQKKVLDEIIQYLDDEKIHIVAAPGAGKTILALQLMIEINKPTLIFVPTIALREQWIERFKKDFNDDKSVTNIVSNNILIPKLITVCTYQTIYQICKDCIEEKSSDEEFKVEVFVNNHDIVALLKEKHVSTIILDEAHHLKKSWWNALTKMINKLEEIKIISLTATPPYDVISKEWNNYLELCGDIDAEISIPELVQKGELAPHQDYVYFNYPSDSEIGELNKYSFKSKQLYENLCNDGQFITAISLHPGIIKLDDKVDLFIEEFDYFISILSFLKYKKINFLDDNIIEYTDRIPIFDLKQMEVLLTFSLFKDKDSYSDFKQLFKEIKRELNEIGAIEDSKVNLIYNKETKKLINQNIGKLDSINQIIINELSTLKDKLKLVIITDYIRDDIYGVEDDTLINQMGAIPIFKSIKKNLNDDVLITVLTGKVVIIPTSLKKQLIDLCIEEKIDKELIDICELVYDFDYSIVVLKKNAKRKMVSVITKLFNQANIQVLIGTSSLIGEGWDAPFVNTLIMASFVGSFVMSNQIRGRAIRIDKSDENKTANIWHLICVEQTKEDSYILGSDYELLQRRFDMFEGIFLNDHRIDKGIERLEIANTKLSKLELDNLNKFMNEKAKDRQTMKVSWQEAVKSYVPVKKEKLLYNDFSPSLKKFRNRASTKDMITLYVLGITSSIASLYFTFNSLYNINYIFLSILFGVVVGITVNIGRVKTNNLFVIKKIGEAMITSLYEIKKIQSNDKLIISKESNNISFFIENGSVKDNNIFNTCFKEMLSKIATPRYLIKISQGYYQVPTIIGKNKAWTKVLEKNMKKSFLNVKMVYVKNMDGKKVLLKLKLDQKVRNIDEK